MKVHSIVDREIMASRVIFNFCFCFSLFFAIDGFSIDTSVQGSINSIIEPSRNSINKNDLKDSVYGFVNKNINEISNLTSSEIETTNTNTEYVESTTVESIPEQTTDLQETTWNLVWKDDFEGPSGSIPSRNDWIFDIGHSYEGGAEFWGNNEAQYYTDDPENVSVDGKGVLRITPLMDETGNWTSARIETVRKNFKAPEGGMLAIEGRIQMPNVKGEAALGYWPAFWALGGPYRGNHQNWPEVGEFDIMENINGMNYVWGVLHCGLAPNDPCREKSGLGSKRPCMNDTCQSSFHTYRFEWDNRQVINEFRWYVDGVKYHSVTSDVIDAASWKAMTEHSGYFILLNVAIGGSFPNAFHHHTPTAKTEPGHPMLVDYVAVYST